MKITLILGENMKLKWLWQNLKTVIFHKYCVYLAGKKIGGISFWRLFIHDWTKFLPSEFPYYARQFYGDKGDPLGFAYCWVRHQNRHEHHWQYWVPRTKSWEGFHDNEPLPMPEVAVREMMADWLGAGRAYAGSWPNLHNWDWLNKNLPNMKLHPDTKASIMRVLFEMQQKDLRLRGI